MLLRIYMEMLRTYLSWGFSTNPGASVCMTIIKFAGKTNVSWDLTFSWLPLPKLTSHSFCLLLDVIGGEREIATIEEKSWWGGPRCSEGNPWDSVGASSTRRTGMFVFFVVRTLIHSHLLFIFTTHAINHNDVQIRTLKHCSLTCFFTAKPFCF